MMVSIFHLTWLLIFSIQFITIHSVSCNNAPEIENCETACEPIPRCKSHEREGVIDPLTNARKPAIQCGLENTFKKKECGPHINDKDIIPLEFAAAVQCSVPDNREQDLCYEQHATENDFQPTDPTGMHMRTILKKQKMAPFASTRRLVPGRNRNGVSKSEIWKIAPAQFRRYFILNADPNTINHHNTAIINAIKQSPWFLDLIRHGTTEYNDAIAGYNRMPATSNRDVLIPAWIPNQNINCKNAFLEHVYTEFRTANPGKFIQFTHHRYKQDHIYDLLATEYPHLIITEDVFKQDAAARAPRHTPGAPESGPHTPGAPESGPHTPGAPEPRRNSFIDMAHDWHEWAERYIERRAPMAEEERRAGPMAEEERRAGPQEEHTPGHGTGGGSSHVSGTSGGSSHVSGTSGGPAGSAPRKGSIDIDVGSEAPRRESGTSGRKVAHQSYFNKLPGHFTEEKYDYDRSSAPIFDLKFYLWSILLIGMGSCCICVALMCFLGGISIGWIGKNFVDNKSDVISIECSEV